MAIARFIYLLALFVFTIATSHALAEPAKPPGTPVAPTQPPSNAVPNALALAPNVVPSKEFVEFSELDPVPENTVKWSVNSGKYLYLSPTELPYVYLSGSVMEGVDLQFNHRWVPLEGKAFEIKIPLKLVPTTFTLRVFRKNRRFQTYRIVNHWLKVPPGLNVRVQEPENVVDTGASFADRYNHSAFVQLYSRNAPIAVVDLDSQRHAALSFRVYPPPEPEPGCDGWNFTIKDEQDQVVGQAARYGPPPPFIDWREVSAKIYDRGNYTYQLNLTKENTVFEGPPGKFETIEGLGLLTHSYLPKFAIEPRQELGFFNFINKSGLEYGNVYLSADLALVFWNRFIARGLGSISMHSIDPNSSLGYTRFGGGFRFFGDGENRVLGRPYMYQLDILLNHTAFTVSPQSSIRRFTSVSILIEPQLVLWGYHYLIPWAEYGARSQLDFQRLTLGMQYQFYIRPWNVKIGMGIVYDNLFKFDDDPTLQFRIFRTLGTVSFLL